MTRDKVMRRLPARFFGFRLSFVLALLALVPAFIAAGEPATPPAFARKPAVIRTAAGARIEFAADRETDAAVYVLDAQGKCIRHLAAGVIGGKGVPPDPFKPGLSQSVEWDGKDDSGKPAVPSTGAGQAGGPFKVRVRLGMKPEFDGFLLDNAAATGAVGALAIGPGGQIYLWHRDNTANSNQGTYKLKVIDRDGKYLRTLMPYPADLVPDKAKVFGAFADADGNLVPRIYNLQQLSIYYEASGQRGRSMADTCSPAVDGRGRAYWIVSGGRLEAVEADGRPPYDTFLSEPLFADVKFLRGQPALCMGSDGKPLYVAGIGRADDEWGKNAAAVPCVWRIDTATRKAEVFLGDPKEPGKEKDRFTAPRGLAAAKGLLYVADPGADRVAVFQEADRSFVGEIKVKNPQSIGVDPASGAIYVCAYTGRGTADLIKLSPSSGSTGSPQAGPGSAGAFEKAREVCRLTLPKTFESGPQRIAVDASVQPVRIWLPTMGWQSGEIYCFEDLGDKFAGKGDPRDLKASWAAGPRDLTVDRLRDELYVKHGVQRYYRLDVKTGKVLAELKLHNVAGNLDSAGTQLVAAPDGSLITHSWGRGLRRLDRDGKPLNWSGRDSDAIPYGGIMTFMQRYLAVPSPEELFIILPTNYRKVEKGQEGHGKYTSLNVIGPDGTTKRTVIWQCSAGAVPRLDARGNVYLADMLKPPDRSYPEFFDDKLGRKFVANGNAVGSQKFAADQEYMGRFWESSMYGSIVKFPPSGGIIWYGKNLPPCVEGQPAAELLNKPRVTYGTHIGYDFKPVEVQGAEWVRFGFSPWAEPRGAGFCMCEGVGFDVDAFGRVFYPNLGQFRVEVVDTVNNWITTFGKYGNQDDGTRNGASDSASATPNSELRVPRSRIPLAWPTYVAVSDDYAFVNDTVSSRVVRVKLGAAAEETAEIKGP